jgi:hypothetical protein
MKMAIKRLRIIDNIILSKNFKTFYDHLETTVNTVISKFEGAFYIIAPKISNLKYEYTKDVRIVCDITF